MGSTSIFAIADDLTGALEAGAKFAAAGMETCVTTRLNALTAGVVVFDTETRHMPGAAAAARIKALAARASEQSPRLIYKKTDSTLRGNIGAELNALAEVFPDWKIVFVPAYPAMGRTVRDGELLVDGIPVHQTPIGSDLLNPVHTSSIRSLLGGLAATIMDGETDDDIGEAARQILAESANVIVAGPSAIAGALAAELSPASRKLDLPPAMRCLIVNGSLHPASIRQMSNHHFNKSWVEFKYEGYEQGLDRATRSGTQVKALLTKLPFEAIIVFGGDTAFGIHEALGASDFVSCGEILAGVPVSKSQGRYWITKAGGFGSADLLEQLKAKL